MTGDPWGEPRSRLPLELGTLRVYGAWFGRPMDNLHTVVAVEAGEDKVVLRFDADETLEIWKPENLHVIEHRPDGRDQPAVEFY